MARDDKPPRELRDKPAPKWSRAEVEKHAPDGKVWDRDGQRWVKG